MVGVRVKMMKPSILLVHGAWHGSWCWELLRSSLESRGLNVHALDHPTVHSEDARRLSLADDARGVQEAIDALAGDVIVVAHSYGGVPATIGATSPRVRHIIYICAFVLEAGESLLQAVGGVKPEWWETDGTLVVPGNAQQPPQRLFYGDLEPARADAAAARLRPQALRAFTDPVTAVAWRDRPTTYILTEQDAVFPVPAQEALAARAGSALHRLNSSHSPFLSQPDAVARIIEKIAARQA
jgi:pimeloyl-ACP methyl ester carboxylesterase